jgi:hypothetical protein
VVGFTSGSRGEIPGKGKTCDKGRRDDDDDEEDDDDNIVLGSNLKCLS